MRKSPWLCEVERYWSSHVSVSTVLLLTVLVVSTARWSKKAHFPSSSFKRFNKIKQLDSSQKIYFWVKVSIKPLFFCRFILNLSFISGCSLCFFCIMFIPYESHKLFNWMSMKVWDASKWLRSLTHASSSWITITLRITNYRAMQCSVLVV